MSTIKETVARKIAYNGKELEITSNPYPHITDNPREIVWMGLDFAEGATFDEVHDLVNNSGDLMYYVKEREIDTETGEEVVPAGDWEFKASYPDYTCGEDGFIVKYENGSYHVDMKRKNKQIAQIERNTNDLTDVQVALAEITESLLS